MSNPYDPKPFSDQPPGEPLSRKEEPPEFVEAEIYEVAQHGSQPAPQWPEPPPLPPPIVGGPLGSRLPSSGKATTAMILGIVSVATVCFCYGVPSVICGIIALVMAGQAEREMAAGEYHPSGLGQAKTGRICGIIGVAVGALIMLAMVGIMIFAIIAEESGGR